MSLDSLTEEEVKYLSTNPYIQYVSTGSVRFTPEFREFFYQEKQKGRSSREILREKGINPNILGDRRIRNLAYLVKKEHERESFSQEDIPSSKEPLETSLEEKIKILEHRLAYAEQEVEFLKKLRMADLEAQKEWESKHRPK